MESLNFIAALEPLARLNHRWGGTEAVHAVDWILAVPPS